jgi:predicted nucleic acid-binding protein
MHRLFLDANVLFSAGCKPDSRLRLLWEKRDVVLLSSPYALEEATRNITRLRPEQMPALQTLLCSLEVGENNGLGLPPGISLAAKDVPILSAAIAMRATHLLTGDKRDFGHLRDKVIEGVCIMQPADYLALSSA